MKTLVVYYSLSGNTEMVARHIADWTGAQLCRLQPVRDIKPSVFAYILGGFQVLSGAKPELQPLAPDPKDFDVLLVGTPVWAGNFVPALRSFFESIDLEGKQLFLFATHQGGPGKVFEKMRTAAAGAHIIGAADFAKPVQAGHAAVEQLIRDSMKGTGLPNLEQ